MLFCVTNYGRLIKVLYGVLYNSTHKDKGLFYGTLGRCVERKLRAGKLKMEV